MTHHLESGGKSYTRLVSFMKSYYRNVNKDFEAMCEGAIKKTIDGKTIAAVIEDDILGSIAEMRSGYREYLAPEKRSTRMKLSSDQIKY